MIQQFEPTENKSADAIEHLGMLCDEVETALDLCDTGFMAQTSLVNTGHYDGDSLILQIMPTIRGCDLSQQVSLFFLRFDPVATNALGMRIYTEITMSMKTLLHEDGVDLNLHECAYGFYTSANDYAAMRRDIFSAANFNLNDVSRKPFIKPLLQVLSPQI